MILMEFWVKFACMWVAIACFAALLWVVFKPRGPRVVVRIRCSTCDRMISELWATPPDPLNIWSQSITFQCATCPPLPYVKTITAAEGDLTYGPTDEHGHTPLRGRGARVTYAPFKTT